MLAGSEDEVEPPAPERQQHDPPDVLHGVSVTTL
jgi:hypothetical protein